MYDMTVYLIRHGETDYNKQKQLQGRSDIPLNAYGRELAEITGRALKDVTFDFVYSSPLNRAMETAKLLLGDKEVPVFSEERIIEISFGEHEGKSYHPDHFTITDKDFMYFFQAPEKYKVPGYGESFEGVIERTGDFWNELVQNPKHQNRTILVSTHGCALKAILANIRNTPVSEFWGEGVHKNCAVTIVRIQNNHYEIEEGKIYY